ncbi:hypothetical protein ANCDUO_14417 [Ancylostoma duodenale]|uniref:Reverse transcriptase domain-containing protein n=1 Tax=Ancylostoma duodenale TaxID=51022 RepID=A0A0C2G3G5_9BILA|nr:hypothetical protein ANCDUO_14417 [Ancylostoma duodenale]
MIFFDAIRMDVFLDDRVESIPFLVGKGLDEVVILGTNALHLLGIRLVNENLSNGMKEVEESTTAKACSKVTIKNRVFVPPKAIKTITLATASTLYEPMFWSSHPLLSHGVCKVSCDGELEIPVLNNTEETVVFRKGGVVGECSENEWRESTQIEAEGDLRDLLPRQIWRTPEERMKELFSNLPNSSALPEDMKQIICEHSEAFAVVDAELTQTDLVVHEIDTGNHMPIRQKTRPVPMGTRKEFKGLIKGLVGRGIIEKSNSDWASPVVLVRKKDGTIRLCVDYRQLNKVTTQDSYPLPSIDMMLQSLSEKKVFSTLDMASGYWQIRLSEDAKKKSAFTTSKELFQFVVLPFGLCTSPAVFQRMMDKVLDELNVKDDEIFVYICRAHKSTWAEPTSRRA